MTFTHIFVNIEHMVKTQTLKGFRDFLPEQARKRHYVINKLTSVFELFGFQPLETPALEYEELLMGKYGEEGDQLMYRFEDNGNRRVAMRYDQTVPLARVITQYGNQLPMPFKRYQIQNVWRAENTQKGRYREFLQCDIDTVGTYSALADAEIIVCAVTVLQELGFTNFTISINDRQNFKDIPTEAIIIIDKIKKIGKVKVEEELKAKGYNPAMLDELAHTPPSDMLNEIFTTIGILDKTKNDTRYRFDPTLARGLNYYTGIIFEIEIEGYESGSVAGGGRYDDLIGMFSGEKTPAVGFAFGFDRLMEAMSAQKLFPKELDGKTQVLVSLFNPTSTNASLAIASRLREAGILTELYLGEIKEKNPLEKQIKYALAKQIPYLAIIGPDEAKKGLVTLKNLVTREQKQMNAEELVRNLA